MKLPNSDQASVPERKLTEYLLSETHAVGKFKAKFFRRLGFNETNTSLLQKEILDLAQTQDVKDVVTSDFGIKYTVEGTVETPIGKSVKIRSVWIVEKDQTQPIFITAYPV